LNLQENRSPVASFAWSYLYTLAAVSVTFVGFSSLVIVLRQAMGGEMSRLDILITRTFVQVGFLVAAGAMLPALLSLFRLGEPSVWRISSAVTALPVVLFAVTYPVRRRAASGLRTPVVIWIDVLVILGFGLLLGCNALGVLVPTGPGPYTAALTGVLFVSGWAYLQALNTLIRHHRARSGQ
jgi:hypothetical protein